MGIWAQAGCSPRGGCYDAIVVGLGAMGAAATYQLARSGTRVLGLDRFRPPHTAGSTHGQTRITRLAVAEGPEYVPLVQRSHQLWRQIEHEYGTPLLTQCGGLVLADTGNAFLSDTRASASAHGIEHENLTAAEMTARFPALAVRDGMEGYYEPHAGWVRPEASVEAQLALAARHGAELHADCEVSGWAPDGDGVAVTLAGGATVRAARIIVSAGAWIGRLAPELAPHLTVRRQVLYWFTIEGNYQAFAQLPVFIWGIDGLAGTRGFYGFPAIDGPGGGLKIATEQTERATEPDLPQRPADEQEIDEMVARYVAPFLPGLGRKALRTSSCLYTVTAEGRFIICPQSGAEDRVLLVSACSGHGFKHSAAIGQAAAQWACEGHSELDLSPFGVPSG